MDNRIDQFVVLVRHYISLLDEAENLSLYNFLHECLLLLPQIYAHGLKLPDVDPLTEEPAGTQSGLSPGPWVNLGKYDLYREVFDPVFDDDIVVSSLGDDLQSIYDDLMRPLPEYESGNRDDAIWSWKFNIKGHCGDHIVDSLRAIHRLVNDHMPKDYDPSSHDSR